MIPGGILECSFVLQRGVKEFASFLEEEQDCSLNLACVAIAVVRLRAVEVDSSAVSVPIVLAAV